MAKFMSFYILRRLLPWVGKASVGTKRKTVLVKRRPIKRLAFATAVAAMVVIAGLIIVWDLGEHEPESLVMIGTLGFYNTTLYPPVDGHVLWRILFLVGHAENQPVTVDVCDFSIAASDGAEWHFAWRVSNLTFIEPFMPGSYEDPATRLELPGSMVCRIIAPFELPQDIYPIQIIWRSVFGEVVSDDFGEWGQLLLYDFLEG